MKHDLTTTQATAGVSGVSPADATPKRAPGAAVAAPSRSVPAVLVVRADASGASVEAVHDDALALHEIGELRIRRASTVEFEDASQRWVATDASSGRELARDVRRTACVAAEIGHFNRVLAHGESVFDALASRDADAPAGGASDGAHSEP